MRVAALADVHGNATALAAVLAELDREQPYDLDAAIERMRAAGMPRFAQIEELMRTPPPQADVIEHTERLVFSG